MNVDTIVRESETGEACTHPSVVDLSALTPDERDSFDEIVASGYSEEQALDAIERARADVEEAKEQRTPWRVVAETLRLRRAEKRVARLDEERTYVEGPFATSRALRRADGHRGYRHGLGPKAASLKTRRRG